MMQPKVKNKNKWMNKRQVLWIIWQKARRAGISASRCLDWGIRCRFPYAPVICEKNLWFLHFWKKYRHPWDRSWVLFGDWAVVCVNQELETRWQWGALASLSESRWHIRFPFYCFPNTYDIQEAVNRKPFGRGERNNRFGRLEFEVQLCQL